MFKILKFYYCIFYKYIYHLIFCRPSIASLYYKLIKSISEMIIIINIHLNLFSNDY